MKVMLVIGARPQIIKSAPIIHEASRDAEMEFQLVHTGQHYDYNLWLQRANTAQSYVPSPSL